MGVISSGGMRLLNAIQAFHPFKKVLRHNTAILGPKFLASACWAARFKS